MDTVEMFDYWAFHKDGTVQFIQICGGKILDYREYADVKDAPVVLINHNPDNPLRYHGTSYLAPSQSDRNSDSEQEKSNPGAIGP